MHMARDKDGNFIDEPTVRRDAKTVKLPSGATSTTRSSSASDDVDYDARTVKVGNAPMAGLPHVDDERTRVVGGRRRRERAQQPAVRPDYEDAMDDPVSGWLVVVDGPGKGRVVALGYGMNSIGRGQDERARVDFGDDQISRKGHAIVTYESRGRKFYVQPGQGTNLAYLGNDAVLMPTELAPHSEVLIGNTTLRFVPLCNDAFDWQDTTKD